MSILFKLCIEELEGLRYTGSTYATRTLTSLGKVKVLVKVKL